jgi:hypothetical protein
MKYYYFKNDDIIGPLPLEDLLKCITRKTLVKDNRNEWKLAIEFPEIASKIEILNVDTKQIVIPPLPNIRNNEQSKPNDNEWISHSPLEKSAAPKIVNNEKMSNSNNIDIINEPPALPQKKEKSKSVEMPPLLFKNIDEESKADTYTHPVSDTNLSSFANDIRSSKGTAIKSTIGGRKIALLLFVLGIFAGAFLLQENSSSYPNRIIHQEQVQYEEAEDVIDDEENSNESPIETAADQALICRRVGCNTEFCAGWYHRGAGDCGKVFNVTQCRGDYCSEFCCERDN